MQATDPDQPVFAVQTMEQSLAQQRWPYRVFGTMFTIFAIIALVLSSVGIYAVTAYSVTQRTQEIGVRMALGARPRQVSWLILRQGLVQLLIGLTLGTAGAVLAGPVLQTLLVQIKPSDPDDAGGIRLALYRRDRGRLPDPGRAAPRRLDPLAGDLRDGIATRVSGTIGYVARHSTWRADAGEKPRLHADDRVDPGPGHRRERRGLQHRQRARCCGRCRSPTHSTSMSSASRIQATSSRTAVSYADFVDYRDRSGVFSDLAGVRQSISRA